MAFPSVLHVQKELRKKALKLQWTSMESLETCQPFHCPKATYWWSPSLVGWSLDSTEDLRKLSTKMLNSTRHPRTQIRRKLMARNARQEGLRSASRLPFQIVRQHKRQRPFAIALVEESTWQEVHGYKAPKSTRKLNLKLFSKCQETSSGQCVGKARNLTTETIEEEIINKINLRLTIGPSPSPWMNLTRISHPTPHLKEKIGVIKICNDNVHLIITHLRWDGHEKSENWVDKHSPSQETQRAVLLC